MLDGERPELCHEMCEEDKMNTSRTACSKHTEIEAAMTQLGTDSLPSAKLALECTDTLGSTTKETDKTTL